MKRKSWGSSGELRWSVRRQRNTENIYVLFRVYSLSCAVCRCLLISVASLIFLPVLSLFHSFIVLPLTSIVFLSHSIVIPDSQSVNIEHSKLKGVEVVRVKSLRDAANVALGPNWQKRRRPSMEESDDTDEFLE